MENLFCRPKPPGTDRHGPPKQPGACHHPPGNRGRPQRDPGAERRPAARRQRGGRNRFGKGGAIHQPGRGRCVHRNQAREGSAGMAARFRADRCRPMGGRHLEKAPQREKGGRHPVFGLCRGQKLRRDESGGRAGHIVLRVAGAGRTTGHRPPKHRVAEKRPRNGQNPEGGRAGHGAGGEKIRGRGAGLAKPRIRNPPADQGDRKPPQPPRRAFPATHRAQQGGF